MSVYQIGLLLFTAASVQAAGLRFHKFKSYIERERWASTKYQFKNTSYPDMYLEQPLDNFDPLIQSTYMQRYWVNKDYWNSTTGPVFLYIGGEGALNSGVVEKGEHIDLAKQYGALVFAVEHRYYGKSINHDGLALENMQYLSSQQALADLANFHRFASKSYNLSSNNTWICFGGSYPGNLAAWFRIKYPHLVYGAISSSAPVHAKVNFEDYNNVVKHSLSDPLVNGSKQCSENVKKAFSQIDDMLASRKNEQLSKDFNSCETVREEEDVYTFVSNLADIFMGTVQYNAENADAPNITSVCAEMTNASFSPYDNLRRLLGIHDMYMAKISGEPKANCTDNLWATSIKVLTNTTVDTRGEGVGIRQWLYQTCSQFGYYQTCDVNTSCVFSRHMTLSKNLRVCSEVFAIPVDEVHERVQFTNSYYGSDQPRGTRIVFVNGSIDPWHALGVLHDVSSTETAIFIPGTAHCANMRSASPTDPPALVQAKKAINKKIGEWLKEAHNPYGDTILRFKQKL